MAPGRRCPRRPPIDRLGQPPQCRRAPELHFGRVDLDADRPDGGVAYLNLAGQEGVHLLGAEDERVLAGAQAGLPEEELGQHALHADTRIGHGLGRLRLTGPRKDPGQDRHSSTSKDQDAEDQEEPPAGLRQTERMSATLRPPREGGKLDSVIISLYMKYRLNQSGGRRPFMDRWRIQRFDPFRELTDMQTEINRAFDAYFGGRPRMAAPERAWAPPIDVYETRDELVVAVEIPGVREKDIHLSMTGDVLSLRGQRGDRRRGPARRTTTGSSDGPAPSSGTSSSRSPSRRRRSGPATATASSRSGCPKLDEVKPREIKIEVG